MLGRRSAAYVIAAVLCKAGDGGRIYNQYSGGPHKIWTAHFEDGVNHPVDWPTGEPELVAYVRV